MWQLTEQSAFVPDGQGLASSQFSTSSPHDAPQKNLDVTSLTFVAGEGSPADSPSDGMAFSQGVPPVVGLEGKVMR